MNNRTTTTTRSPSESLIATHTVLRNTYLLLSLTLIFSSLMTWYAVISNAKPMGFLALIGMFGLLFLTRALRNSAWGIVSVFAFTGFMGYMLGPMIGMVLQNYTNGAQLVMTALGMTGAIFFVLSGYVLMTRKDFSSWGHFLMVGLIVVIVAIVINIFLQSSAMFLMISTAMVFIASMLIMYDTSRIIHNGERNYLMATIALYLDIFNLFVYLLQLLSMFSGRN